MASCHTSSPIIGFTFKSLDQAALMSWRLARQAQHVMLAFFGPPNVSTESQVQMICKKSPCLSCELINCALLIPGYLEHLRFLKSNKDILHGDN